MDIRNDLKHIKEEFNNDEKMLEGAFRIEAFVRKNKIWLIGVVVIGVLFVIGYQIRDFLNEKRAEKITEIFAKIQKEGASEQLMEELKSEGKELYDFVALTQALNKQDKTALNIASQSSNPFIAKYASYELALLGKTFDAQKDYGEFKNFVLLQEGYLLILKNKHQKALEKFDAIEPASELKDWALRIGHYGIGK